MAPFGADSFVPKRRGVGGLLAIVVGGTVFGVPCLSACGEDVPSCYAGDFRACACNGGGRGFQACRASSETEFVGEEYGVCVCDGTTPGVDASATSRDAGGDVAVDAGEPDATTADAGRLGFLAPCETNEQCETDRCHTFPSKGTFCTKSCTTPDECPPPSSGCNNQGLCRP